MTLQVLLQFATFFAVVTVIVKPGGGYMANVFLLGCSR
jgi:K+-transporting ATPase A subunit